MKKKEVRVLKPLYTSARLILGKYLKSKYNVRYEDPENTLGLAGPYVLLGNHTNFWDPVFIVQFNPHPVHFVTSDEYFRKPILGTLLNKVGAIPKTKFFSDSDTVKNILRVKKNNGIIGIFPEGRRNWDGSTLELLYPTAKLIKKLRIPVVTALLKGAYLSYPRWAKKPRKGELSIHYKISLSAEEVVNLTAEQIHQKITQDLAYDAYSVQRQRMIPYKGAKLAENLELFLFTCPHCKQIGTMRSQNDQFYCENCKYTTRYNEYGFLEKVSEPFYFDTPADWNIWQLDHVRKIINSFQQTDQSTPFLSDQQIVILRGERAKPLTKYVTGHMNLFSDHISFKTLLGEELQFFIDKIHGINIQYNDRLEFYYEKVLYRFVFEAQHTSAYKWAQTLQILKTD